MFMSLLRIVVWNDDRACSIVLVNEVQRLPFLPVRGNFGTPPLNVCRLDGHVSQVGAKLDPDFPLGDCPARKSRNASRTKFSLSVSRLVQRQAGFGTPARRKVCCRR